jgi:hypothetical protein
MMFHRNFLMCIFPLAYVFVFNKTENRISPSHSRFSISTVLTKLLKKEENLSKR